MSPTALAFVIAGVSAAAATVAIHLLNRRRYRTVEWAAMDFLREALKRNRRVLQIRDLLLLLLRATCALLFGLALAAASSSFSPGGVKSGGPVHAVLIVDNSLSMGLERLDGTLLKRAKSKAREFIDLLPSGSRVSVLPLCGSAAGFSWDPYRTKQDALDALDSIEVVDRAGSVAQAADLARQACSQAPDLPAKRVALISDQQARNWPADALADVLKGLPEMQLVDVGAHDAENAWVAEFKVPDGIADIETTTNFAAKLRYEGNAPRSDVQVTLNVDGAPVATTTVDLEPGQERELSFPYRFELSPEPGHPMFAAATLSISGDRLPLDDERSLVVPVVAALPVVFVDQYGSEENPAKNQYGETFRLRRLLAPVTAKGGSGKQLIQVRHKRIDELDRDALKDARLVVIAGIENPGSATPLLREFVEQGGQLVICAGGQFDPGAWNNTAWQDGAGILPAPLKSEPVGQLPEEATAGFRPFQLDPQSMVHDYFLLEGASSDELSALYAEPLFFKAVAADVSDETIAGLITAETKRLEQQKADDAEAQARLKDLSSQQTAGKETDKTLQARAALTSKDSAASEWLLWRSGDTTDDRDQPLADRAQKTRPRVLALYNNKLPFLVERKIGHGDVLFCSTGVESGWNTFTSTNAVLVFDRILRHMLQSTLPNRNVAGADQILIPVDPADRLAEIKLIRPGRQPEPLSVDALGGENYGVVIRNPSTRGIYRVVAYRTPSAATEGADTKLWEIPVAVNGPQQESELAALDESRLAERLGQANYRWISPAETIRLEGAALQGRDFWKAMMAAVLVGLLLEVAILAWPYLRKGAAA